MGAINCTRNACCQRIRGLGLGKELTYQIVDTFGRWVSKNGPEWTADRIKSIKTDYIRSLAGKEAVGEWYSKKRDGSPKGPFGALWKKDPALSLAVLEITSTLVLQRASDKQLSKFLGSVQQIEPKRLDPMLSNGFHYFGECLGYLSLSFKTDQRGRRSNQLEERLGRKLSPVPSLIDYGCSPTRRMPVVSEIGKPTRTVPETNIEEMLSVVQSQGFSLWRAQHQCVRDALSTVGDAVDAAIGIRNDSKSATLFGGFPVGKISFIQEPSCKLRAVANPHRIFQVALSPLWERVDGLLEELFEADCTHDQESGVLWAQEQLRQGKQLWSVDLSDATNNFPLKAQENLLRQYSKIMENPRLDDQIDTFVELSRAPWALRDEKTNRWTYVQWNQGQPLGLKPSFATFALAHHAAVFIADNGSHWDKFSFEKRLTVTSQKYRVLGDDIVISDPKLYEDYRKVLERLGCPISESKTLECATIGEFAGRVITKDRILRKPKWRSLSDDSFLDVARSIGPRSIHLLRPRQRRVLKHIAPLPVELGGCGWNPEGKSLEARMQDAFSFVFRDRVDERSFIDSVKRFTDRVRKETTFQPERKPYLTGISPRPTDQDGHRSVVSLLIKTTGVVRASLPSHLRPPGFIPETIATRASLLQVLERFMDHSKDAQPSRSETRDSDSLAR